MKIEIIDLNDERAICFKEVFSGVMFETEEGERLSVCMRDGAFEICTGHRDTTPIKWYSVSTNGIDQLGMKNPKA